MNRESMPPVWGEIARLSEEYNSLVLEHDKAVKEGLDTSELDAKMAKLSATIDELNPDLSLKEKSQRNQDLNEQSG